MSIPRSMIASGRAVVAAVVLIGGISSELRAQSSGPRSGTFRADTGNRAGSQQVVIQIGEGPYSRRPIGARDALAPQDIAYRGLVLQVSNGTEWMWMEICEERDYKHALIEPSCREPSGFKTDRAVKAGRNTEYFKERMPEGHQFDPTKYYVLIWRELDSRGLVRGYSTRFRFIP